MHYTYRCPQKYDTEVVTQTTVAGPHLYDNYTGPGIARFTAFPYIR